MWSRLVTVTLAVAMGLLVGNVALSQTEAPPPDPAAPGPVFDDPLQSGLPLGELGPGVERSTAREPVPDLSRVARDGEWMYALRRRVRRVPLIQMALGLGALGAVFVSGWVVVSASRRRARRGYRRLPRSAGGSRLRGLEEVVASVQLRHSKNPSGPPLQEPVTGPEWPR